jgi:hypothetical protein
MFDSRFCYGKWDWWDGDGDGDGDLMVIGGGSVV